MPNRLVIWVEGKRDQSFFEAVAIPVLAARYQHVLVRQYSEISTGQINRLLNSLEKQGFERLFVADLDSAPCATRRKEILREHYPALRDPEIIVVSAEIEAWYLAGTSTVGANELKLTCPSSTDRLAKQEFDALRPHRFDSVRDFMIELLKYFDVDTACQRNTSFAYFHRKFLSQ